MSDFELRVPAQLSDRLVRAVDSSSGERVAFGLVSSASIPGRRLMLLRELIDVPDDAYLSPGAHGARWNASFTIQVLSRALTDDLGVVIFHEHSFGNPVGLSRDDMQSGKEQLEVFTRIQPHRPHGTVVVGRSTSAGMFSLDGELAVAPKFKLRLIRGHLDDRPNRATMGDDTKPDDEFASQALIVGGVGQRRLQGATVAVVGQSGGGSHVVQQLAHLGVGRIIGIDHDRAEQRNRSRMVGLTGTDVRLKRRKTAVLARVVRGIGLGSEFVPVVAAVPSPAAIAALREADIIVGCLDNYHARADLQQLAWRLLIPYVDIGLRIDPDHRATLSCGWIGGNVNVLLPGSFCMWCSDYLTRAALDAETDGRGRGYLRVGDGAAQVVSFNGVLASQAVNEVLQLLTGFAEREATSRRLKMNAIEGTLKRWHVTSRADCVHCREQLGAGDAEWQAV